jgi:hypothetical protein
MNRRGFLGAMLGVMAAPAVVKAENLMRIVVPKRELIVGRGLTQSIITFDDPPYRDYDNQWVSNGAYDPEKAAAIQAAILATIREQVYKTYLQSGYNHNPRLFT